MNRQGQVSWKLSNDLVTHISIRRIANRKKSQTMRDPNERLGGPVTGFPKLLEKGLQRFQSRHVVTIYSAVHEG